MPLHLRGQQQYLMMEAACGQDRAPGVEVRRGVFEGLHHLPDGVTYVPDDLLRVASALRWLC